jgi:hypothetical protein
MSAIMVGTTVVPAAAASPASDNGKAFAEGAFRSLGVGGAVVAFGAASPASPTAADLWDSVRIFGYMEGPSFGRVYCGDVWNVIVTIDIPPPWFDIDRATMDMTVATQRLDGVVVGATDETAVRWSSTLGVLTQAHGTFLPPGTLADGFHVVSQTLEDDFGIFWAPIPLEFEVSDSAC